MNPEQESDLFTALGRIEQKLDSNQAIFEQHTANDLLDFAKLGTLLSDVDAKIIVLNLTAARKEGEAIAEAAVASRSGAKMGALVGGAFSIVIAAISAWFSK